MVGGGSPTGIGTSVIRISPKPGGGVGQHIAWNLAPSPPSPLQQPSYNILQQALTNPTHDQVNSYYSKLIQNLCHVVL